MLRAGLALLWRDRDTVQIGVDPRRAVAISGGSHAAAVIRMLDGSRERDQVIAEARGTGIPREVAERIIALLAGAGVLIDHQADAVRAIPAELRRDLMPVLATASLTGQDGDGGLATLARRRATSVEVRGRGGVASAIISLLTQSGVAASSTGLLGASRSRAPDLVVLTQRQTPALAAALVRLRQPHLAVYAGEAIGVVGPLVQPGRTACLNCLDLTRAAKDPAWPLILAQLPEHAADLPACDPVLAASVAAQAASQVLAFADRAALRPATVSATLELVLPSWQWRRRGWPPHPACICRSHAASQQVRPGAARAGGGSGRRGRRMQLIAAPRTARTDCGWQVLPDVAENGDHERPAATRCNQDGQASLAAGRHRRAGRSGLRQAGRRPGRDRGAGTAAANRRADLPGARRAERRRAQARPGVVDFRGSIATGDCGALPRDAHPAAGVGSAAACGDCA